MSKPRLYIPPGAQGTIHDTIDEYKGVVPFCADGIQKHFFLTDDPGEAHLIWLSQWRDGDPPLNVYDLFPKFDLLKRKCVMSVEGDRQDRRVPFALSGAIVEMNGARLQESRLIPNLYVRTTFSRNLVDMARGVLQPPPSLSPDADGSFVFRGFPDPHGVRQKLGQAFRLAKLPGTYELTPQWTDAKASQQTRQQFLDGLAECTFALCPRGNGFDSVRFFEACWAGRVPIMLGDALVPRELDGYPTDFFYRISERLSVEELVGKLKEVRETCDFIAMGRAAQQYFESVIRPMITDPTGDFLEWAKIRGLLPKVSG